jgi:hypothetical protein
MIAQAPITRTLPTFKTPDQWTVVRIHYDRIPDYDRAAASAGMSVDQERQELEIDWNASSHKRVYPEFGEIHIAAEPIPFDPNLPLVLGWDFGDVPACNFTQLQKSGTWVLWQPEVGDPDLAVGIYEFGERVYDRIIRDFARPYRRAYADLQISHYGDPAGNAKPPRTKATTDEKIELRSAYEVLDRGMEIVVGYDHRGEAEVRRLKGWGWKVQKGAVSDAERQEAVRGRLTRIIGGRPGLLCDPGASILIAGFYGAYHYKQRADGTYESKPNKNWHSHPLDAAAYIATRLFQVREREDDDEDSQHQPARRSQASRIPGRA